MADVTQIKTLKVFSWARPSATNPRLAAPISSTATTITVTTPPLDETDAIVSVDFLMGIKNASTGYVETVFVPASGLSVDGLTFTNCVRGIDVSGLDYNTGNTALASDHGQDSIVMCVIHPFLHNQWQAALQGTIGSGANNWKIGDGTDSDITVYAYNADANKPFWRYDKTTSAWIFSNDGASSTPFGTGAGVSGGNGIDVTAGVISTDLAATNDLLKITGGELDTNLTASKTEIDQLTGTTNIAEADTFFGSTDITGAQAETLTDGSDASSLHGHIGAVAGGMGTSAWRSYMCLKDGWALSADTTSSYAGVTIGNNVNATNYGSFAFQNLFPVASLAGNETITRVVFEGYAYAYRASGDNANYYWGLSTSASAQAGGKYFYFAQATGHLMTSGGTDCGNMVGQQMYKLRIDTSATETKFYVDDVLVETGAGLAGVAALRYLTMNEIEVVNAFHHCILFGVSIAFQVA